MAKMHDLQEVDQWGFRAHVFITQHDCHHDTKVKLEAATAVIELLIMGGKTTETC
jgi:hypothetical protein